MQDESDSSYIPQKPTNSDASLFSLPPLHPRSRVTSSSNQVEHVPDSSGPCLPPQRLTLKPLPKAKATLSHSLSAHCDYVARVVSPPMSPRSSKSMPSSLRHREGRKVIADMLFTPLRRTNTESNSHPKRSTSEERHMRSERGRAATSTLCSWMRSRSLSEIRQQGQCEAWCKKM